MIKIEVVERAGGRHVEVCGLRHSRYRSDAAAGHGAKLLAARVQDLRVQAPSTTGRMQLGQRLRVAHCELYCIRTLLRGDADRCRQAVDYGSWQPADRIGRPRPL